MLKKTDEGAETGKEFYWNNFDKIDWNKSLGNIREVENPEDEEIVDEVAVEDIDELEQFIDEEMDDFSVSKSGRINFIKIFNQRRIFVNK